MTTNANTIYLSGPVVHEEIVCSAAVTPGHLLDVHHVAAKRNVRVHATEGGYSERAFAIEDQLQGKEIDTAYTAADLVSLKFAQPGSRIQAWLKAGESVVFGDELISAGDGSLIKNGSEDSLTTVRQVVAIADEVKDLSASGAVVTRLDVRVV